MRLAGGGENTQPLALAMALTSVLQGSTVFLAGRILPHVGFAPVFVAVAALTAAGALAMAFGVSDGGGSGVTTSGLGHEVR